VLDEGSEKNKVHLSIQQGSASILVSLFSVNHMFCKCGHFLVSFVVWTVGLLHMHTHTHTHTQPFCSPFSVTTPCELVPEENFWTLWCKGRLTEAGTLTIRLGATPSGLTSAHLLHPSYFFTGQMPFLPPNQQCQSTEGNLCIRIREKML